MGAIAPRNSLHPQLPEHFGKYSLLGHLVTGGMVEVWLARRLGGEGSEKIVVIKRARPDLTDHEATRRFFDEARLVMTLDHPSIAKVYEVGSVDGQYFFVTEYVAGVDLRRLIDAALARHRPLALADALYIIIRVCAALHHAHDRHDGDGRPLEIVHRDVTPSNVLVGHDGAIKVCDFGIARAIERESEITQPGAREGRLAYRSPEQCESKPVDRRSDVFSIGVLLYELTTLTRPFRGAGDHAQLQQIIAAPIPPPSSRLAGYPRELEAIVMKALARPPRDRYQTARALQLDLEDFARAHGLAMSSARIAELIGSLFEHRDDAWVRSRRARSEQLLGDYVAGGSGTVPPFLAVGSGSQPAEPPPDAAQVTTGALGFGPPSPALWLVGAALAGLVAGAISVADRMITSAGERATASALASDAERISAVFEAAARSAHMRADGIATTPMLRAAIETDAATLRYLASTEMVFTAEPGETLEVFQLRGAQAVSLLRLPRTAAALEPLPGRNTRVTSDGRGVILAASAPISGYGGAVAGGLVIATPVDLSSVRRALDDHAVRAALTGLGNDITLAGPSEGVWLAPLTLPVPATAAWGGGAVALTVIPRQATGLSWAWHARTMSGGLAAVLLAGFLVGLARRARSQVPEQVPEATLDLQGGSPAGVGEDTFGVTR